MKCVEWGYLDEGDPHYNELCHCPVCGSFLPAEFPIDEIFKCKKCNTELMNFQVNPELSLADGKICPISKGREVQKPSAGVEQK